MRKWVMISLAVIFFTAVLMRLYPITQYEIWGSDSGEYFRITDQLVDDGYLETEYDGWGFGYPHFPGMFHFSGSISLLTGIDTLNSMIFFVPIAAAFSVLLVFVLAKMLFRRSEVGVLAGAITAVAMPHVFTTSHPMPGSLGDLFLVLSLILFIASYYNRKFVFLLLLSSLALIITHHLSSYFFFIMGLGGLFVIEFLRSEKDRNTGYLWAFLVLFLTLLILYWSLWAQPFAENVVGDAFDVPLWLVLSGGYVLIFFAFILVKLRRRSSWEYQPGYPEPKFQVMKYSALLIALVLILGIIALTSIPGTTIDLEPATVLLFLPFLALVAFGSVGPAYIRFHKNGMMVYGWMIALFLSILVGVITSNRVLLPYRHPQYLVVPLGLLMGMGIVMLFKDTEGSSQRLNALGLSVIVILLVLTAFSAYPPKDIMGGFQEGTSEADMQGVLWAGENLPSDSTVASDHRMSSMIFGFGGLNATWDAAERTLHGEDYQDFRDEIRSLEVPSGTKSIDYVLLDDDIREGAALLQWENARPMSQKAQEKFERWPFVKLYEADGVQIYGIVE
jgi:4-amino-4-deoxy-L-arabinose transferase-like glycosyltransferase